MLQINDKTFMNLQEAVQWLLDNNALPFQSSANYVANTEIGLGTIVNPSPAKVRIGSLIFFSDSKVSTVIGLTSNSFIVSDQYNDLVDDIVYISNVSQNDSGHLIVTFSNGKVIDAGLIKQVTGMYINTSQHLIVSYNDSSTADLGAIFSGNVNIDGNFTANSIIEKMEGYSFNFTSGPATGFTITPIYAGVCKNGNKITFVWFMKLRTTTASAMSFAGDFIIPKTISDKLFALEALGSALAVGKVEMFKSVASSETHNYSIQKYPQGDKTRITLVLRNISQLSLDTDYYFRVEATFLLNESLAS